MVTLKWDRPLWLDTVYFSILTFFGVIIIDIIFDYIDYGVMSVQYTSVVFAIILSAGLLLVIYSSSKAIWHSIKTRIDMETPYALSVIHIALNNADGPFFLILTSGRVPFIGQRWVQIIVIRNGSLRLHIQGNRGIVRLFLGPVGKDNEGEVAKVKGILEKGFAEA